MKARESNLGRATSSFARWAMMSGALASLLSVVALTEYLGYINANQFAKSVKVTIFVLGSLLLWVGMWTFAGRAIGGSRKWAAHFCVAAFAWAGLLILIDLILPMAAFALGWSGDGWFIDLLLVCALGLMVLAHLRVNHGALSRPVVFSVASLTALVAAGGFAYNWAAVELKPERMPYSSRIEPGVIVIVEGQSIDAALTALTGLSAATDKRAKTLRD